MATPTLDRQVEARLREHSIRYTAGRKAVITALAAADGPRSAAELSDAIGPDVPLSSLYRSLTVLEEAGILDPHHGTRGLTRYEIAEWLVGHHHHLMCTVCGTVEDINIPEEHETRLRALIHDVSAAVSFTPTDHTLEIEGRCQRCV